MAYETDLGKENYYIAFSYFFFFNFVQNHCHVFHRSVTYTVIYSEITTVIIIFLCFLCI